MHSNPGTVLAWDEGRRFAFADAIFGELMPVGPFMISIRKIVAEDIDGVRRTRYTATGSHWTEADFQRHVEIGFEESWGACANQLIALAEA